MPEGVVAVLSGEVEEPAGLQQVLGFSALRAGFGYLPLAGFIISAGSASPLITRFGFKPVLMAGLAFTTAGLAWFSRVSPDGSYATDLLR